MEQNILPVERLKRYLDSPIMCDGKAQCNIDERIQQNDYATIPSYSNLYLSVFI